MVQLIAAVLILAISVFGKHIPKDLQLVLDKLYDDGYGVEYTPNGTSQAVLTEHLGKADFVSDILGYVSKILSNTVASGEAQDANIFLTNALSQNKGNRPPMIDSQVKYAAVSKSPLPQTSLLMTNGVSGYRPPELHGRHAELTQSVVNKSVIKQVIDQHNSDDLKSSFIKDFTAAPISQLGAIFNQNHLPNSNNKGTAITSNHINNGLGMLSGGVPNPFGRKLPENSFKPLDTTLSPPSIIPKNKEEPVVNKAALFDLFSKFMLEDNPLTSPELHLMISNLTKMIMTTPSQYSGFRENAGTQHPLPFGKPILKLKLDGGFRKDENKGNSQAAEFKHRALENFFSNAKAKGYDFSDSLLRAAKGGGNNVHLFKLGPNELPHDSKKPEGNEYRPRAVPFSEAAAKNTADRYSSSRIKDMPFSKSWWHPQFTSKDSDGLAIFQKAIKNAHWNHATGDKDPLSKLFQKLMLENDNKRMGDVYHGPDR